MQYNPSLIALSRLSWDDWNIARIARHHVTWEDVEEVCQGDFLVRQTYNGRLLLIGPTASGNLLAVILAPEAEDAYYVVTARPAAKKERRMYREIKGDPST